MKTNRWMPTLLFCIRLTMLFALIFGQFGTALQPAYAEGGTPPVILGAPSISVVMDVNGFPTAFHLTLLTMDADPGDILTWSISSAASHGAANVSPIPTGNVQWIFYNPNPGYSGTDSFEVQVADLAGDIDIITVNVFINPAVTYGAISGTVLDTNGNPIPNVMVCATKYEGVPNGNCAQSLADGSYLIGWLDLSGDYRVDANAAGWAQKYYNNTYNWGNATRVPVTLGTITPGIDFSLEPAGRISGYVYQADGVNPIPNMVVVVSRDGFGQGTCTDSNGYFSFSSLPFGHEASVRVDPAQPNCNGQSNSQYAQEYWNDTYRWRDATNITLSQSTPNEDGILFTLNPGGNISGKVLNKDNSPAQNAQVCAYESAILDVDASRLRCVKSGPDGSYVINSLPVGNYRVSAQLNGVPSNRSMKYYDQTYHFDEAASVPVTQGMTTSNIDFQLKYNPAIEAALYGDYSQVGGYGWTIGHTIQLTINNVNLGSLEVGPDMGDNQPRPIFPLDTTLQAHDIITLTDLDNGTSKTLEFPVANIETDTEADTVTVSSMPSAGTVIVGVNEQGDWNSRTAIKENEDWVANFSIPGVRWSDEQNLSDLVPGNLFHVDLYDEDMDWAEIAVMPPVPILTVTAQAKSKIYGDTDPGFTFTYSGFLDGDDPSQLTTAPTCTVSALHVNVGVYDITCSGGVDDIYSFNYVGANLSITPATLTVKAGDKTKILNAPNPDFTRQITGFVNGENENVLTTQPTCTSTATQASGVGSYPITCSGAAATNYTFNYVVGTLKVIYRFDGFLQPINDTAHSQICGSPCPVSIFKGGSTVPAKFQLKDVNGNIVQPGTAPLWVTPQKGSAITDAIDEAVFNDPATSGTTYSWNGPQYHYNWSTKDFEAGYYWRIGVKLDDGQTYYVYIGLR